MTSDRTVVYNKTVTNPDMLIYHTCWGGYGRTNLTQPSALHFELSSEQEKYSELYGLNFPVASPKLRRMTISIIDMHQDYEFLMFRHSNSKPYYDPFWI